MKIILVAVIAALLSSLVTGYFVYNQTRTKWFDLGRTTGEIHGRAEVQKALCAFAAQGKPPVKADYVLAVKANRLSVVKSEAGLKLYCE